MITQLLPKMVTIKMQTFSVSTHTFLDHTESTKSHFTYSFITHFVQSLISILPFQKISISSNNQTVFSFVTPPKCFSAGMLRPDPIQGHTLHLCDVSLQPVFIQPHPLLKRQLLRRQSFQRKSQPLNLCDKLL